MGMGGGFGQSQGDTGVGASPTTTGQSQSMGQQYGGKGGGAGAGPQLQQPSQSSTSQPQRYQPTGGNVFGYNMNRLASRMDPSASLPGDMTQQQPQYQAQDTFQPQYQPQDTFQSSFGGKGGGRGAYEPDFFEPQYQQQPQQQQNPFAEKQSQYESQISSLQDRLDKLISQQQAGAKPAADSELSDTGEAISKFDKGREETGVGSQSYVPEDATLSPEDVRKGQADSKAAADTAAAKIDPATGKPKYQFGTYNSYTSEQLTGLDKNQINSLYKGSATAASKDIAQAKKDVKNAKTPEQMKAANATLEAANKRAAQIKTDQKATQTQMGRAKVYSAPVAATPAPAPTTSAAAPAPAPAASAPRPAPAPAASAAKPAAAPKPAKAPKAAPSVMAGIISGAKSSKKAKGGSIIVHKGMTSKLKKQLKNK